MKKIILLGSLILTVVFTSCMRKRECVCTDSEGTKYTSTMPITTKSQQKSMCLKQENDDVTCVLKNGFTF
jgi:hypothetical protein